MILDPSITNLLPISLCEVLVFSSTWETAAIVDKASPRKPFDDILNKSSGEYGKGQWTFYGGHVGNCFGYSQLFHPLFLYQSLKVMQVEHSQHLDR